MEPKQIVKALGGTTATARLIDAPASTVSTWITKGRIPPYRLELLKLRAEAAGLDWPA